MYFKINCQVVPVNLVSKSAQKQVYAFLDIGSEYTIMDQALAEELGLEGEEAPLAYKTIDGAGSVQSKQVSVEIQNISNNKCYMLEGVYTFPNLDLYGGTVRQAELNKWKHLANLNLPTYENCKPQLLIGLDNAHLIASVTTGKVIKNAPIAAETKLGWTVFGKTVVSPSIQVIRPNPILNLLCTQREDKPEQSLSQQVEKFFSTEDFGVKLVPRDPMTEE